MPKNKQILMISLFLTIATLAVYWQVNHCDFINFDDPVYVTENNDIQNGITMEGIRWAFTTNHAAYWHPLTWISHMLDVQLFGLKPRWHHLTNLLFHIANTLLLFYVLHRMTKAHWESAFVAALFALHPLHVESVAWVAERKDVLSAFFWILTMGAYCSYVEHRGLWRYLIVVLFIVLGLMAKPMLVTLPFVLLLLDFWPLRRFQQKLSDQTISKAVNKPVSGDEQKRKSKKKHTERQEVQTEKSVDSQFQWALIRPLLWEKVPLFALIALSSMVIYTAQHAGGAVTSFTIIPLSFRVANAFVSYIIYLGKTIWPKDLAVIYPYPFALPIWQIIGAAFLLTAIMVMVIWKARKIPYVAMGWLWFVGTLVPVIGFVQVGKQARADRFTYVPLIGLFIMATWGISEFSKHWRYRKEALITLSTVILVCLCIVTWTQVSYWQNSVMLFDHALNVTDNNYIAYYNRGDAYATLGEYGQALADYDKAIKIYPNYAEAYINRGKAYADIGNDRQAIGDYDKAIAINPKLEEAYSKRGDAYSNLGNYRQAIVDYDKAIEINPRYADAYYNRGYAYSLSGNSWQASENLKTAARLGHQNAQGLLKNQGMGW